MVSMCLKTGYKLMGDSRLGGSDTKPSKKLICEKTKLGTSAKPMMVGKDLPAEQLLPWSTSTNRMGQAYVTSGNNKNFHNVNSFSQDSASAKVYQQLLTSHMKSYVY